MVFSLMDIWILKETILDRQYEQASVTLQDHWTVIDIGAALGDYSVWAGKQIPHGRLIAVEPYPQSVSLLRVNLEKNKVLNAEIFTGAIASSNGTTSLTVTEGKVVQNSTAVSHETGHEIDVRTITLDELMKSFSIQKCDYLKIDCEGGEYEILFTTPKETLAQIDRICMEIHDGLTVHTRKEMIDFLNINGFVTRLTPNPVHQELAFLYAEKSTHKKERS
ncbi:MAG: FkbM family methyltransferase [Chloroflexi bacterium]|nr:MAG: FkbM family methyltransferase [Chloroflexota bacterium]MBA4375586.1 FkbM family methyltransferase [Anaerolinea sp.]